VRAHRLFVQDDVVALRDAQQLFDGVGLDEQFFVEAAALASRVEYMLLVERRDQGSADVPRFSWSDIALLERLVTRLADADRMVAARHWRSLVSSMRLELQELEAGPPRRG
jgi:hypothetical protein